jgi:hypothetical protein
MGMKVTTSFLLVSWVRMHGSLPPCPPVRLHNVGLRHVENFKLRGLSPQANYADRATAACRRSHSQLLRIEGVAWSEQRNPTAVNLGFINWGRYFFEIAPQLRHEAEWTPFYTQYFSGNLVAPGMEPGTSGFVCRNSDH